ncbi:hypothetical protein BN946_scf185028.g10 [Trametes cinnabarina]|uniref:Uncharacterized protein n=1 Tax=Pycnoporus cinnabarinus TaxID=5643 RepID=A0A060SX14_PYCCI|nr:hypothetical protein BN946_scf185028.g10 [Trametes cinnabarina]
MPLLGETVEASREKRLERQQARFRDRGGWVPRLLAPPSGTAHRAATASPRIFKPAEHNPLLDLLLARGVNGESPSRANSPRRSRSRSASPKRRDQVSSPSRAHTAVAPAKRPARKSESKQVAKHSAAAREERREAESAEPAPGPSKASVPQRASKDTKKRMTKFPSKQSRSKYGNPDNHVEERHDHVSRGADPKAEAPLPATSTKAGKASRAKKPSASEPASRPKRAAKGKAPPPERPPEPEPEFELGTRDHSDDEPLVRTMHSKSKSSTTSRLAATVVSSKRVVHTVDSDEEGEAVKVKPGQKRRAKDKKAATDEPILPPDGEPTPAVTTGCNTAQRERTQKGKRKAKTKAQAQGISQEVETVQPTASRSKASSKRAKAVAATEPVHSDDEPLLKPRKKRRPVDDEEADSLPVTTTAALKSQASRSKQVLRSMPHPVDPHDEEENDAAPQEHHQPVINEPSSPDLPLAKVSSKAKMTDQPSTRSPKRTSDASAEVENEMPPPPPPKKRKPSPENDVVAAVIPNKEKRRILISRPDSPGSRATRPRAPPVFAPKGAVLKPKPKPRLSLFPAPSFHEDSEEDPIDLLS